MSRIFVEKKAGFNSAAQRVMTQLSKQLSITNLSALRLINVYDIEGVSNEDINAVIDNILAEPNIDHTTVNQLVHTADLAIGVAYLPGQFDQRADSAEACIEILTAKARPVVKSWRLYLLSGNFTDEQVKRIKAFLINPIDSREVQLSDNLIAENANYIPADVAIMTGFNSLDERGLAAFKAEQGFAMSLADLAFIQRYFATDEDREPTITELKAIDTYWSDHCRHTTFLSQIDAVNIAQNDQMTPLINAYKRYLEVRAANGIDNRPITLMDMATIGARDMKRTGVLDNLDQSEEINACSIKIPVNTSKGTEEWLLMFKNETHNHPTEIEPFGGAATCLGGAIRDPLSGRSYVYQAMRVTGSANPFTPLEQTLPGKLAQRKITTEAAQGYSSYGNQIGLATGWVQEIYHDNYVAKRMEVGCVVGACPKANVVRETPVKGDIVILLGGKTGRDGCGGATGSSKVHTEASVEQSGAEVQKGNAPTERKIQRLFRNGAVTRLIKRCNDFGAGGVSVAIGEIAPSIDIYLDRVPKKYEGLDGTELAISESQERMAVVVANKDVKTFIDYAQAENLEATVVADITNSGRLRMYWRDQLIFDIARSFLDSNGVTPHARVQIDAIGDIQDYFKPSQRDDQSVIYQLLAQLKSLNCTSQKGLIQMFDGNVGAASVLMPIGGIHQLTPADGMVAKLPVLDGDTTTCSCTTVGFDADLAMLSPFYSAYYAVVTSLTKIVALGFDITKARLSLQEYFEKLGDDPLKWGKPFSALLGAFSVQDGLSVPAIGGKDSMSGSFGEIDVPPTLLSFAVSHGEIDTVISPELKSENSILVLYMPPYNVDYTLQLASLKRDYQAINQAIVVKQILSAKAIGKGGALLTIAQMAVGNGIGFAIDAAALDTVTTPWLGGLVLEVPAGSALDFIHLPIGVTHSTGRVEIGTEQTTISQLISAYTSGLEDIFSTRTSLRDITENVNYQSEQTFKAQLLNAKPNVYIPVFPGTNSEYDMTRAFSEQGGSVNMHVFKNLSTADIEHSLDEMVKAIKRAQIIAIPGGFSGGDEPDGSAKMIATIFKNPRVAEALMQHLTQQDGLMLGICNGFQALVKLGLIPYGQIKTLQAGAPTLTHNAIGKHISTIAATRIASNNSPWLANQPLGKVYHVALSHGEGRFVADDATLKQMIDNGQIATQYVDFAGNATMDNRYNPNGSVYAIEGAFSPDGRVFGKMGHTERYTKGIYKNVPGHYDLPLFKNGIDYYK